MEKSYSNRELDRMFSEIKEQLDRIEVQTSRTNGRVRKLEIWRGGMAAALALLGFLFPYLHNSLAEKVEAQTQAICR